MTGFTDVKKITTAASDLGAKLYRIWVPIQRVLTFSPADDMIAPESNLSVSIDKGSISIAYGSRFLSKINIRGIKQYSFEEDIYPQPEDLLSSLSLAINEFSISKTDITLSIPKAWTIIRTVDLPSTVKENLPDVISYELDRLTPFNATEAFYDFRVREDKVDRMALLLMTAKTDQIRPYIDLLEENGFAVSRITVNLSAIGSLLRYRDKSDTLFVEIGNRGYECGLFSNGLPVHNFSGSLSGFDEKTKIEMICKDIKSLLNMSKNKGGTPQIVGFFKDNSTDFEELLISCLDMPVSIMWETDIGLKLPLEHKDIPAAAVVGGVIQSLGPEASGLNLLKKGRHEKQKTPVALTILLILAIATIWVFYLIAPLKIEEKRLQEISAQIVLKKEEAKKVEALKKEAESLREKITAIDNFKHDRIMTINILRELSSILPKNAWLSRARIASSSVDIEGYAGKATELLPKLEASKYFRKVEFSSPIMKDARMTAEKFNIKMEIEYTKNNESGEHKE
ncbi:MAG: PilN domain-containing protein [Thermodesulfovibrionales bacterium]